MPLCSVLSSKTRCKQYATKSTQTIYNHMKASDQKIKGPRLKYFSFRHQCCIELFEKGQGTDAASSPAPPSTYCRC